MSHSDPILADPLLLLREASWLQRLARGLCSDRALAEDLSQETLLAAWQQRGRVTGPLRPWLAGVLRRLHANRRRAQARRQRREAAAAPRADAPATDEVVARAGLHRDVVDAVMQLDEPYRTAILLRYFEDLPPREVARRLSVPVETVRSRVQRGVGKLRDRLDRTHGSRAAWLGPLAAMAETYTPGAGAGAGVLALLGLLLMQTKVLVPALVLAGGLSLYYIGGADARAPSPETGQASADVAAQLRAAGRTADTPAPGEREEPSRSLRGPAPAVVTGRLLRARDTGPCEGAEVVLYEATDRATLQAAVDRLPPLARATTDAAGRYRVEAPDTRVWVVAAAPGYATLISQPRRWVAGATADLGDALMHRSLTLSGRVRDTAGQPVADLRVTASWRGAPAGDAWVDLDRWFGVRTDADGRFQVGESVREGTWWITFDDRTVELAKDHREVTPEQPFLDLIVDRRLGRITGTVVDERGQPLAGHAVNSSDGRCYSETGEHGEFTLERRRGAADEVGLRVWRHRFQRSELVLETATTCRWGQDDVRLVVPRGVDVQLRVVQAPERTPVERFSVDMQRDGAEVWAPGGTPRGSGTDERHPGGVVDLPGMVPGRYRVLVVQPDRSTVVSFEVFEGREGRQDLVLPAVQDVTVEVVDGADNPVAGSRCDLIRPGDDKPYRILDLAPKMREAERGGVTGLPWEGALYRLAGGTTDGRGRLRLALPADGPLVLRVFGTDHAPLLHRDLRPEDGVVRVVVDRGAVIAGRITPAGATAALHQPSLFLQSVEDERLVYPERFRHVHPGEEGSFLQVDGRFSIPRVPAGSWRVCLLHMFHGRNGAGLYTIMPVAEVRGLRAGEVRTLELDCSAALPVKVRGFAMFRGKPARHARLDCEGPRQVGQPLWGALDCDDEGRFEGLLAPGSYAVTGTARDPATGAEVECAYPARLVVTAGREAQVTLDLKPR